MPSVAETVNIIIWFSVACVCASLFYYAAATIAAFAFARRCAAPPSPLPKIAPRVAILKPLHGMRKCLVENLTSFMELDYPRKEYLFAVANYEDPAAEVAVALKSRYSFAATTLVVGLESDCANRKVGKLIRMVDRADKAEIFVLSDSDVEVDRDHLLRIVSELCADEKTGVVTSLYRARPNDTAASALEALFVNTDFAPLVLFSSTIEPIRYALGATVAVKREVLEAIGGFRAIKDRLADDYFLGQMASQHGYDVKLSSSIVTVNCEEADFADFWHHQIRWARTYRTTRPISIATIVTHGPFWALMLLAAAGLNWWTAGALAAVLATRIGMSALIVRKVLKLPELTGYSWLVPLKDLVMTGIWIGSLFGNEVRWSGRRLRIHRNGTMQEADG
jgi:ceramide glucosyltransferase